MKKIEIQGKRNQDRMKVMDDPDAIIERKNVNKWTFDDIYYDAETQLNIISNISEPLNQTNEEGTAPTTPRVANRRIKASNVPTFVFFEREIERKLKGYRRQDELHKIYDERYFISLHETISLMQTAELCCHYCKKQCTIIYKESFSKTQWTLDRIDNNFGHNRNNVVISCLDCNLQRGTMDSDRFRSGKQFTFVKKGE